MDESMKTAVFAGVAIVVGLLAVVTYPKIETAPESEAGKLLFPDFKDSTKATTMSVVRVNEDTGTLEEFKVERTRRGWVIPSHGNYPADAEKQMQDASTLLLGLEIDDAIDDDSTSEDLHEKFGVVEPDEETIADNEKGIGTLVKVEDDKGKELAALIIGKKTQQDEAKRFVRKPNQSRVYVVTLDIEKLSTEFEKWIEQDLLGVNASDIEELTIKDYVIREEQVGLQRAYSQRPQMEATVKSDNTDWELKKLVVFDRKQQPKAADLAEQEELNDDKLDELKDALDDLKIVNVQRKPDALGADLKAGTAFDQEGQTSLVRRGFFPVKVGEKEYDVVGSSGEVLARTKEGVEFLLRFGGSAGTEEGTDKVNRYLMVGVRLNEDKFTKPEKPVELDEKKVEEKKESEDSSEAKTEQASEDEKKTSEEKKEGGEGSSDESDDAKDETNEDEKDKLSKIELDEIRKQYERDLEDYNEKRGEANKKVRELNARFADWYYVISEDMYKKMRISRATFTKEKDSAKEEGFGVDAFRKLEKEGLKKSEDSSKED